MRVVVAFVLASHVVFAATDKPDVTVMPIARDGQVLVSFELSDGLTAEVRDAIQSGLPTTFSYEVELRRQTSIWFDRTVASVIIAATVRFDNLTRRYQMSHATDGRVEDAKPAEPLDAAREWMPKFERVLVAILAVANRTASLSPDFLTEFVLYALSAADFTILFVFVWLLARNIVKLVVERRRGLPFARFRSKLVALLLAMTLVPAVLVLMVGSELIRTSVNRWFNAPMDEILASADHIASDYYHERQVQVSDHATR